MRFLIVDDVAHVRESLQTVIELEAGWQVIGATNDGQHGLRLARELHPDIVVLDAHLADADAMEVARALKAQVDAPGVVMLTVHDSPETVSQAQANGVDLCIAKGEGVTGLMKALRTWRGRVLA